MNEFWYSVGDEWYPLYVNKVTGEEKTVLDPDDKLVDVDAEIPAYNVFNN